MSVNNDNPLEKLKQRLSAFADKRDWQQFHSPKNLSMALIAEAAELVEIFQWLNEEQANNLDNTQQQEARMELADIFIYLVRIADKLNVNLIDSANEKIDINEHRFPIEVVKGNAKRADEYKQNQNTTKTPSNPMTPIIKDPVTGLLEYPIFKLTLEPQLARCRRYNTELCMLRIGLNFSERADDTDFHAGHLRSITQTLKQNLRWADQVGRASNGQFLLVLPETSSIEAKPIIEKIHTQLESLHYVKSVHYGVSSWLANDNDDTLTTRTESALQQALQQNLTFIVL